MIKNTQAKLTQSITDILEEIPHYLKKISKLKLQTPLIEVDSIERKILQCIPLEEAIYLDDLSIIVNLSPAELLPYLLKLELKGLVAQMKGQRYCKKIIM
ncbi:MAG: hypothetical protein A2Y62_06870 [Candidatus Fischerbacteria bacterium RBG_13_37_8]|uniref:DprA winged helix domain-containing protein n=1 Tax=Candidatus Fischerbacteria bacterium RBG_13_37_8 TaxID=1817863 RepID=A0A1F5VMC2_9BACT|nr:MAG: hypothetical protein A2Y62_06870 [Candidatus Fischerbacteria bacterium RBG_13_37_8]